MKDFPLEAFFILPKTFRFCVVFRQASYFITSLSLFSLARTYNLLNRKIFAFKFEKEMRVFKSFAKNDVLNIIAPYRYIRILILYFTIECLTWS